MIIFLISHQTIYYDHSSELSRLVETVQMRDHNVWFYAELTKIIFNYHQILPLI